MEFTEGDDNCSNCNTPLIDDARFCSNCGSETASSMDKTPQEEGGITKSQSERKRPGPLRSLLLHFMSEDEFFNWLPNCPSCGSKDITGDMIDFAIECERCGTLIEYNGGWEMTRGTPDLVGESHSGFTWKKIAKRQPRREEIPKIVDESTNERQREETPTVVDKSAAEKQKNESVTGDPKRTTLGVVGGYLVGGITAIAGVTQFFDGFLSGVIILIAGLWALPPVRERIEEALNVRFSRWLVIAIFVVLYGFGAWFYDSILANTGFIMLG
ncbi:zinc ribbon domain-containing protein [Natrialbaceae archaeon A-CW1-1]